MTNMPLLLTDFIGKVFNLVLVGWSHTPPQSFPRQHQDFFYGGTNYLRRI